MFGLDSYYCMNVFGVFGGNWGWCFYWGMLGYELVCVLGFIIVVSGCGFFELLKLLV